MAAAAAPITFLFEEEAIFLECFSSFVQNYLGERNIEWLERHALDEYFNVHADVLQQPSFSLFLSFCVLVYNIDSRSHSIQRNLDDIDTFLTSYNSLFLRFSNNEPIQDALREIRVQIENRQTVLLHRIHLGNNDSNSDTDSDISN